MLHGVGGFLLPTGPFLWSHCVGVLVKTCLLSPSSGVLGHRWVVWTQAFTALEVASQNVLRRVQAAIVLPEMSDSPVVSYLL